MDEVPTDPDAPPTPLTVDALLRRAASDRERAASFLRTIAGTGDDELVTATRWVRRRLDGCGAPGGWDDAYVRLVAERHAIDAHDERMRRRVGTGIRDAIARLRAAPSSWSLVDGAAPAVCDAGGFTRAMVSAVRGSRWVPLVVHTRDDLDPKAETFRAFVNEHAEIPLATMLGETEMVRRRTAMRITDPVNDRRTFKTIILAAGTPGYAAAPIIVGSRILGFVHVDRVGQEQPITEDDRVAVGTFAADLGWLFHRASTKETLERRAKAIDRAIGETCRTLEQVRRTTTDPVIGDTVSEDLAPAGDVPAGRDALLTGREREILELVADGATNWGIAEQLTLSEETVKTHMRTIRRKLRVKSRSAAVARYRRLRETT